MAAIPSSEIQGQPRDATTQGALLPRAKTLSAPSTPSTGALGGPEDRVELEDLQPATTPTPATPPETGTVTLEVEAGPAPTPDLDTSTPYEYEATGDPGLDYALAFIGSHGYGENHPAVLEAKKGNFDLIAAELAQKDIKGYDAVVRLAKDAFARKQAETQKAEKVLLDYASKTAGGEQNWKTVQSWASKNLTPASKAQVNAALDQGGLVAEAMIDRLVNMVRAKVTLAKQPGNPVSASASASGSPSSDGGPLDSLGFKQGLAQLRALAKGRPVETSDQYKALQARRAAGMAAGLN